MISGFSKVQFSILSCHTAVLMLWFSSGTKSHWLGLVNDPDLAQNSCFVTTKHSWKCPGISLKIFSFVLENVAGNYGRGLGPREFFF